MENEHSLQTTEIKSQQKESAKPTGRRYETVEALMKGEGVSKEVQDMVKTIPVAPEPQATEKPDTKHL